MANLEDLPEDSDSSDEDYIPDGKVEEVVSEVESDGDPEEPLSDSDQDGQGKGKKRKRKVKKARKKIKKCEEEESEPPKVDEPKASIDDLWADFVKDTGFKTKTDVLDSGSSTSNKSKDKRGSTITENKNEDSISKITNDKPESKVKITQIFEFAGEEVKVEKEVDANSVEARLLANEPQKAGPVKKSGGLKGIGNVLSQIGKKQKLSVLEKTKLDWNSFKKEENIDEDLKVHNKGKDGYLERQDFLQRTDLRQFEIEKSIRDADRAKRFNSTL